MTVSTSMNTACNARMSRVQSCMFIISALWVLMPSHVSAEGVVQMGIGQDLLDYEASLAEDYALDDASASVYVDVLSAGEVINVSLCGSTNTDDITVEFYAPSDNTTPIDTQSLTSSNVDCADPMTAPLTNPMRYTSLEEGTYRLVLQNTSRSGFSNSKFRRYDITVTPDAATNPNPTAADGRLWGYTFAFNAGDFGESGSTDANYYALIPGGRPDTNYVWQLDLNNFAGFGYNLVANSVGLDAPNSGYSDDKTGNTVTYEHPMYVGFPAIADPQPTAPPVITGVRFVDSDGQDYAFTPGETPGIQDSGTFEFTTDVAGTYSLLIDVNQDGVYGNAGDRQLLGLATVGLNQVLWDGTDADGLTLSEGIYFAQVQVHMGEYHFIANDAETSGGGTNNGLTIFQAFADGSTLDTSVYWDDVTLLPGDGGSSNTPNGVSSGTPAGRHTWGNFTGTGFGDERYIDTYVYGLATTVFAPSAIVSNDVRQINFDGTVMVDANSVPGNTLSIIVSDDDLDTDGSTIETVEIEVTNDETGELETVMLSETSANSAVFSGSLLTLEGTLAGTNNDGVIVTQGNDTLTITYNDLIAADYTSKFRTTTHTVLVDSDDDGIGDINDFDDDNDGIADVLEGLGDNDGDGIVNSLDTDSDNDGILDINENAVTPTLANNDADNDGIDDALDVDIVGGADVDGNGIADSTEPSDTDNDGIPDYQDIDSDGDGIADVIEGSSDTDQDGTADFLDMDSDNDGIDDADEDRTSPTLAGTDTDNDGIDDALDVDIVGGTDADGNGIADAVEPTDTDNDSTPDHLDIDSDADGIVDIYESITDSDSDGTADYLDIDSDNDGIDDANEDFNSPALLGTDVDNDGIDDALDVDLIGGPDSNGNGIADAVEPTDTDTDGIPDHLDIDSDNDGIADIIEAGGVATGVDTDGDGTPDYLDTDSDNDSILDAVEDSSSPVLLGTDSDNDGIDDALDVDNTGGTDTDGNGIDDDFEPTDTDSDGTPNHLDIDSDADGLADIVETDVDTDGDGVADYLDLDSDNDGLSDIDEDVTSPTLLGVDSDNDGIDDALDVNNTGGTDTDGNGIDDALEPTDTDGDGTPDYLDTDSDADGISDNIEAGSDPNMPVDTDGDGIPDWQDSDSDGDSVSDINEGTTDTDGDGISDALDLDSDNDGISDMIEFGPDAMNPVDTDADGVIDALDLDSDNDGIADAVEAGLNLEAPLDSDGDGVIDALDLDSDNDGLTDTIEANGNDTDGNGVIDNFTDANGDGIDDSVQVEPLAAQDFDADGVADFRDQDSDNDGLTDTIETQGAAADRDRDGVVDGFFDANGNGLDDSLESILTRIEPEDIDGDSFPDHLDIDTDGDGILDLVEAGGLDVDNDGVVDTMADSDNDGIPDSVDVDLTGGSDADADGIDDSADIDFNSALIDTDGDGIVDDRDPDLDGDGLANILDDDAIRLLSLPDADNNGVPDVEQVQALNIAAAQTGVINTGLEGSGCSIGTKGPRDPVLPLLCVLALICSLRRRRAILPVALLSTMSGIIYIDNTAVADGSTDSAPNYVEVTYPVPRIGYLGTDRFERVFYAGLGIGSSRLDPDTSEVDGVDAIDEANLGAQFMLGVDMNKWLSLELHSAELGSARLSPSGAIGYRTFGGSALFYAGKNRHRFKRHGFTAYGRLGYGYLSNRREGSDIDFARNNATHLIFGLGLEYTGRKGLGVRAEGINFDADIRYLQLSLLYRFGKNPKRSPILIVDQGRMQVPAFAPMSAVSAPLARSNDSDGVGDTSDTSDTSDHCNTGVTVDHSSCALFSGVLEGVNFPSGSADLTDQAKDRLTEVVTTLQAHPTIKFIVSAHTDDQGSAASNHTLSKQRVISVGRFLRAAGIPVSRFTLKAFGEIRPIASNSTPAGRKQNRRVELQILPLP